MEWQEAPKRAPGFTVKHWRFGPGTTENDRLRRTYGAARQGPSIPAAEVDPLFALEPGTPEFERQMAKSEALKYGLISPEELDEVEVIPAKFDPHTGEWYCPGLGDEPG